MKKIMLFLFLTGCALNSISPGGGGLEMDFDLSAAEMRHEWTYLTQPFRTKTNIRDNDSIERGEQLFLQHCVKCHGTEGKGDGPLAKALKIKPKNLQSMDKKISNSYLLVQIKNGKGSMPEWRDFLTKKQMIDLTNYIKELSKN